MATAPAVTSATPAMQMIDVWLTAPAMPAARAKGTVSPSAIPMTMSRSVSPAVKWSSGWTGRVFMAASNQARQIGVERCGVAGGKWKPASRPRLPVAGYLGNFASPGMKRSQKIEPSRDAESGLTFPPR